MGLGLETWVTRCLMVGVRISMLMVFAPFFGSGAMPARVKVGLTMALTALLAPVVASTLRAPSPLEVGRMVAGEMLVGLLLGLTLQFVFDGAQLAGQVVGFQLGYSLVNLIDPQTEVETPVLSIFYQAVTLLMFLQLEVHHWLLRGLAKSFLYLPPGSIVASLAATTELWKAAGGMLLVAMQMAAPALVATMLADVTLGYLGKASPQLPVLFLGLSVKSLLGFAVLAGAVLYWPRVMEKQFLVAVAGAERMLHLAH